MTAIGFIGTGTIGAPMAMRLLEHGHDLAVFDRAPAALEPLVARGATVAATTAETAQACDTVFLSLPGPPEVESVMLGAEGLLASGGRVRTVVDLSTNAVALSRELAARAAERGIDYLDAPVSGGRAAAANGTLAVMVGGQETAFARTRPLLECFAQHIFHLGESGTGTLAKLVNNQIFLAASVLIQEGFVLGAKAGLAPDALARVLEVSSAGPLLARAPLLLSRKFELDVFALEIATKDLALALQSAADVGAATPLTAAAHSVYADAAARGYGRDAFFATQRVLEAAAAVELPPLAPRREA